MLSLSNMKKKVGMQQIFASENTEEDAKESKEEGRKNTKKVNKKKETATPRLLL